MSSDLSRDMAEDVLSRIPLKSLRGLRSACKTLSKNRCFKKKHLAQAKAATKKTEITAKKTTISDLPTDLAEEVFSRLSLTSVRGFRSTCKNWNSLSKNRSFTKKHVAQIKGAAARESTVVMVIDFRVYLMNLNLHRAVDPSINCQGKLFSLADSDQVDISQVYHCDGLLLCITKDCTRFVVWNPYLGQTLWFKLSAPPGRMKFYSYAIGYEKSKSHRNYKVLRFCYSHITSSFGYEIYKLKSNSSRVLNVASGAHIQFKARGVSLKGNTYWYALQEHPGRYMGPRGTEDPDFLICFDFTKERFGPRLPIPFHCAGEDTVTLSSVRQEQLALLFQRDDSFYMEIWVTTKIEPEVVLWNKLFLGIDIERINDFKFVGGSFFIDEEEKVVVVFDKDKGRDDYEVETTRHNIAYVIGEDGYYKEVDLGESTEETYFPIGCSYVPSSVRIKQRGKQGGKKRKKNLVNY